MQEPHSGGVKLGRVAIIGAGPAGLMAAERVLSSGFGVHLYDAMPSPGRKFLLAGIGGMNITHSEPFDAFCQRYGEQAAVFRPLLEEFGPEQLVSWIHDLGIETLVGSSGRVFPKEMKAAPLLRAWLSRLKKQGLVLHTRHRWLGWSELGELRFLHTHSRPETDEPNTPFSPDFRPDAVILALGGASWKKLGSDGAWVSFLKQAGVSTTPLKPSNCGFVGRWSAHLSERFAGAPLKNIEARFTDLTGRSHQIRGECILTAQGLEGGVIYALSRYVREAIEHHGQAEIRLDLCPDRSEGNLTKGLASAPTSKTLSQVLKNRFNLTGAKTALLYEVLNKSQLTEKPLVARTIKSLPVKLYATTPLDEAISTAGGVCFSELTEDLMLKKRPAVFCAGEMLDWEAPTGGYLLTGCFTTGKRAGDGVVRYLTGATGA